jgi:peptide/nickel transport system permease protein
MNETNADWGERLAGLWSNWYVQDALVLALLALLFWMGWRMRRQPYWRLAVREVSRRRLAVAAFFVLLFYVGVAVLDSVGWHPPLRDADGAPLRSPEGRVLYDTKGLSALDALLRPLRTAREKTYSAPLATRQFVSEFERDDQGGLRQVYPALAHPGRHLLGTDRVGEDVLYQGLKGIRTGIVLGALTTALVIPFALFFGVVAGYFGGWIDDVIQYLYTVMASIPSVLLMIAFMMIFGRGLPQLCIIMGITSWTGLCRVLRGETLKLREMEFVQSAEAMCVPRARILRRHLVPNVMHLVLITMVLGFSDRVLAEAALTYIGIGVGADTYSWGRMINDARLELARDPVIAWKLATAFAFMLGLLLPANLFGDALRDALDPRLRTQ